MENLFCVHARLHQTVLNHPTDVTSTLTNEVHDYIEELMHNRFRHNLLHRKFVLCAYMHFLRYSVGPNDSISTITNEVQGFIKELVQDKFRL